MDFPDGRLEVRYKGRSMPYRTFDKLRRVTQAAVPPGMRTIKGPKRRDQAKHMFSVG